MAQNTGPAINPRNSTSIEFTVRPREDLFLRGGIRTIPRVAAFEGYPCQMQKNQTFSCLFRHYAKHNGLRKEDLVFYFVNELNPDESPETVHLMPHDEVWVEHKKSADETAREVFKYDTFSSSFRSILFMEGHADVTFTVGIEHKEVIPAHKAILTARCDYFKAMFRKGGLSESNSKNIDITSHEPDAFKRMLEYIYCNGVDGLDQCCAQEMIDLLILSHEFLLSDLTRLCENAASKMLSVDNIGSLMLVCDKYGTAVLKEACHVFISSNISTLKLEENFRREIQESPELALLIVDAIPDQDNYNKRRRIGTAGDNAFPSNTVNTIWQTGTIPQIGITQNVTGNGFQFDVNIA